MTAPTRQPVPANGPPVLIIRCTPEPGESFKGFCLRLAEANGYPNLTHVLPHRMRYVANNAFAANRECLDHVGRLVDAAPGVIGKLGGVVAADGMVTAGSAALPLRLVDHKHPKVCPSCLAERCFLRSVWDIAPLSACPVHGTLLVCHCPKCGKRLIWNRRGVDRCCPDTSLRDMRTAPATPGVVELARAVCHAVDPGSAEPPRGLPPELGNLGPARLLAFIVMLGAGDGQAGIKEGYRIARDQPDAMLDLVTRAAAVLSHWPNGMEAFAGRIWKAGGVPGVASGTAELGLWSQRLATTLKDEGFAFFRDELWRHVLTLSPGLRKSAARSASGAPLMPTSDVVRILGVTRHWLQGWIENGSLKTSTRQFRSHTRTLVNLDEVTALLSHLKSTPSVAARRGAQPRDPTPTGIALDDGHMPLSEASSILSGPTGLVRQLVVYGLLSARGSPQAPSVEAASLESLLARLDAFADRSVQRPSIATQLASGTLVKVTSGLTGPCELAERLRAILGGRTRCVLLPQGRGLSRLAIAVAANELRHNRDVPRSGWLSLLDARRRLGCTKAAAAALVDLGHLTDLNDSSPPSNNRRRYMISVGSVEEFEKAFVLVNAFVNVPGNRRTFYGRLTRLVGPAAINTGQAKAWSRPIIERHMPGILPPPDPRYGANADGPSM